MRPLALSMLASLLVSATVQAASTPVPIVNPSFEDAPGGLPLEVPSNSFLVVPPGGWLGWEAYAPAQPINGSSLALGVLNPTGSTFFPGGALHGNNVALTWAENGSGTITPIGLQQTLDATLEANTRYVLHVEVGNIASGQNAAYSFYDLAGFPGYAVQLLAGDAVIAEDYNSLNIPEGAFMTSTVQAVIGPEHKFLGQPLRIRLINLDLPNIQEMVVDKNGATQQVILPAIEVDFDNVRLDASPVAYP